MADLATIPLAGTPTPMTPMPRLAAELGVEADRLWVKRDDLTALGAGGNKARKLEYLCADAVAQGATVLVTGGAVQSNHVRSTAAAAAMLGLRCVGVVGGRRTEVAEGNVVLDAVFGAELVYASEQYGSLDLSDAIDAECRRLLDDGETPYRIPLGGSSPIGVVGYIGAAEEIGAIAPDAVVYVAVGTGGTHAGLSVGFGTHERVVGVDVGAVPEAPATIASLAVEAATIAGRDAPSGTPVVDASQVGEGYGRSTPECLDAIRLAGRSEGLVLDPVYTAKAFAALCADVVARRVPDGPIVFLHTGGLPGLLVPRHAAAFTRPAPIHPTPFSR